MQQQPVQSEEPTQHPKAALKVKESIDSGFRKSVAFDNLPVAQRRSTSLNNLALLGCNDKTTSRINDAYERIKQQDEQLRKQQEEQKANENFNYNEMLHSADDEPLRLEKLDSSERSRANTQMVKREYSVSVLVGAEAGKMNNDLKHSRQKTELPEIAEISKEEENAFGDTLKEKSPERKP